MTTRYYDRLESRMKTELKIGEVSITITPDQYDVTVPDLGYVDAPTLQSAINVHEHQFAVEIHTLPDYTDEEHFEIMTEFSKELDELVEKYRQKSRKAPEEI